MIKTAKPKNRDIEVTYSKKQFIQKLRRLADCLEKDQNFNIQIAGEKWRVPKDTLFNIEHERTGSIEEIEFQIRWNNKT